MNRNLELAILAAIQDRKLPLPEELSLSDSNGRQANRLWRFLVQLPSPLPLGKGLGVIVNICALCNRPLGDTSGCHVFLRDRGFTGV
jgi:hypothetical protein